MFILFSFFLPRVVALFENYRDLPLPTRILMGMSAFFSANWHWIVIAVLLVGAVFNRLAAMEKGRTFFDGIKLRVPVVRRFVQQSEIARFARTLALLTQSGIPIERALTLSAGTLNNAVLRDEILHIRDDLFYPTYDDMDPWKRKGHKTISFIFS